MLFVVNFGLFETMRVHRTCIEMAATASLYGELY